jgi:hypothetical protein
VSPAHGAGGPVIAPGGAGSGVAVTATQVKPLHPQLLQARTHTFPEALPTVTVIDVVPCPEVIVQSLGTVHVYELAPGTAEIV